MKYEPVIGLEVHAQLLTKSKIFCRCSTSFGAKPNSQTCPICLGMPGVLPVLNKLAVEFAIKIALATNCQVAENSIFARKNYFYPDLPKGYQISQYEEPLSENGYVEIDIDGARKRIGITRIHLEEDAGKSIHAEEFVEENETLVDVNRCGTPLIEIVGKPEIRSPKEAYLYLTRLRQIVQYLEICDGNMEEGSFRCDANVSIRRQGSKGFGVKTELKNMNSLHGVEKALEFEIARQIQTLKAGGNVFQQTLLWDADKKETIPMRSKEFAHDYRYFPEPDLVPVQIKSEWIEKVRHSLPELPAVRRERLVEKYGLPQYDADVLTETKALVDYFEETTKISGDAKTTSNWIMGEVLRVLKGSGRDIKDFKIKPADLAALIKLIIDGRISVKIAKSVFDEMFTSGRKPDEIIKEKGLLQISDSTELEKYVLSVIDENPEEVNKFLSGHEQVLGFLLGQIMKATRGKANPKLINEILRKELQKAKP
ncbi:Asp-tRNA(Asn)/Glu-tRNA(Gln) amidotransferase subunit GatB [candidate division KSB1 bacterium]|nr:Asp-tRNA(Asn)/Glu-tRNA(Gln) amidotransferase subunit GatB [candidate division KSB1 bacterium]TDI90751.1 MAG: Asp-tRNA(Asn)/Glu-tRNA(Gln) amidotransferase subunit GatB [Caldithrix sp.]